LTRFHQSCRRYAKLAWNHDLGLGEYALTVDILLEVVTEQEEPWNKKVKLLIGKLAQIGSNEIFGQTKSYTEGKISTQTS